MKKYTDISTTDFPKTLLIKNHEGGARGKIICA